MDGTYLMVLYFKHKAERDRKNQSSDIKKIMKKKKSKGLFYFLSLCFKKTKHVSINDDLSYFLYDNRSSRSNTEVSDHSIRYSDIYQNKN